MERKKYDYKMPIVLRNDCEMTPGKMVSQACHAIMGMTVEFFFVKENYGHVIPEIESWAGEGGKIVVLQGDENDFKEII